VLTPLPAPLQSLIVLSPSIMTSFPCPLVQTDRDRAIAR